MISTNRMKVKVKCIEYYLSKLMKDLDRLDNGYEDYLEKTRLRVKKHRALKRKKNERNSSRHN